MQNTVIGFFIQEVKFWGHQKIKSISNVQLTMLKMVAMRGHVALVSIIV